LHVERFRFDRACCQVDAEDFSSPSHDVCS
jgi:hypothetical protein